MNSGIQDPLSYSPGTAGYKNTENRKDSGNQKISILKKARDNCANQKSDNYRDSVTIQSNTPNFFFMCSICRYSSLLAPSSSNNCLSRNPAALSLGGFGQYLRLKRTDVVVETVAPRASARDVALVPTASQPSLPNRFISFRSPLLHL